MASDDSSFNSFIGVMMIAVMVCVRIFLIYNREYVQALESFLSLDTRLSSPMPISTKQPAPLKGWWEPYVDAVSVIFQPSNQTQWCEQASTSADKNKTNHFLTGMYLVKVPKTASSTSAAAALQIAESVALKKGLANPCPTHVHHGSSYTSRQDPSFLWTVVRQPHKRAISEYFFSEISRRGEKFNSTVLIRYLEQEKNFQLKYISKEMESYPLLGNTSQPTSEQLHDLEIMSSVFQSYDFIAEV